MYTDEDTDTDTHADTDTNTDTDTGYVCGISIEKIGSPCEMFLTDLTTKILNFGQGFH